VFLRRNQRAERGRTRRKWLASSGNDGLLALHGRVALHDVYASALMRVTGIKLNIFNGLVSAVTRVTRVTPFLEGVWESNLIPPFQIGLARHCQLLAHQDDLRTTAS
jgi:hypothetical protein